MKALKDELATTDLDRVVIRRSANEIRDTGKNLDHWFPQGSGPDAGLETKASAAIWKRTADFQRANLDYQARAEAFAQAAASGDAELVERSDVSSLAQSCASRRSTRVIHA